MNNPRMYAQEDAIDEYEAQDNADEEMLEQVRQGMGAPGGGPPPGSGMHWENLAEDQAALVANPAPENIDAFVQYWGEENLPQDLQPGGGGQTIPMGDAGGGMY